MDRFLIWPKVPFQKARPIWEVPGPRVSGFFHKTGKIRKGPIGNFPGTTSPILGVFKPLLGTFLPFCADFPEENPFFGPNPFLTGPKFCGSHTPLFRRFFCHPPSSSGGCYIHFPQEGSSSFAHIPARL